VLNLIPKKLIEPTPLLFAHEYEINLSGMINIVPKHLENRCKEDIPELDPAYNLEQTFNENKCLNMLKSTLKLKNFITVI